MTLLFLHLSRHFNFFFHFILNTELSEIIKYALYSFTLFLPPNATKMLEPQNQVLEGERLMSAESISRTLSHGWYTNQDKPITCQRLHYTTRLRASFAELDEIRISNVLIYIR